MKRIISVVLILALALSFVFSVPFSASASGTYYLNVGESKYLYPNTMGRAINSATWISGAPFEVKIEYQTDYSCKIVVEEYPGSSPIIVQYRYNYFERNPMTNYTFLFNGADDFKIYVNKPNHTVTFDADGGSVFESSAVTDNSGYLSDLPYAYRSGYIFGGWYTSGGSHVTTSTKFSSDTTVYAHWEKDVKYKITYILNKGTNNKKNPKSYTSSSGAELKSPTRKGYAFKGWYSDKKLTAKVTSIARGSTGNKTLYAKWEKAYKVTYMLNKGTNNKKNPKNYIASSGVKFKNPTRKGYTFKGWYKDSKFKKKVTKLKKGTKGNKTIYAKWEKNYTVKYKLNGGKNNKKNPKTYVASSGIEFKNPTRKGYTFKGWYKDSKFKKKVTKLKKGTRGNKTIYAKWSKSKYKITYKLNKGTNNTKNPKSYTITSSTVTLKNPTRKDYAFLGWYKDSKFENKISKIKKGSAGNLTLYAKWQKAVGSCGKEVKWKYDISTGTVKIYGKGEMDNYNETSTYNTDAPWFPFYGTIKKLIIDSGVTSIGAFAFYGCDGLTSIAIPNTVTLIGERAFEYCKGLTSVTIPDSVTTLNDSAFAACDALKTVNMGNGVKYVGDGAFCWCDAFTDVYYNGTRAQRSSIYIVYEGSFCLNNATWHYKE